MFAVVVYGINLNDLTKRYFEFTLEEKFTRNGNTKINNTEIPLVQCTK